MSARLVRRNKLLVDSSNLSVRKVALLCRCAIFDYELGKSMKISTYYLLITVIMFVIDCFGYKRMLITKSKENKIFCAGEYLSEFRKLG